MKREVKNSLLSFVVEIFVYAALVAGYFFLVLHYMGDWLHGLSADRPHAYAWVALGLIIGQGVLLDAVTRLLLGFIKPRVEE